MWMLQRVRTHLVKRITARANPETDVHIFSNGVRLRREHLLDLQLDRYAARNVHEPLEEEWFCRMLQLDDVSNRAFRFADIGAAVGYYAILLKLRRPQAEVYCFEPLKSHVDAIRENFRLNDISSKTVQVHEVAVSDLVGSRPFWSGHYGSRLLQETHAAPGTQRVKTTTLTHFVRDVSGPLDLVKVDVQGEELAVINGAATVADSVSTWIIGTHGPDIHHACVDRLAELGYRILCDEPEPAHQPDGLIVATS